MNGNTHFSFHHKVFGVDGSYFTAKKGGREPCFNMPMGDAMATVAIPALRKEFGIPQDSEDGRLLDVVESALKYVTVIRVDDAIPSELLDGTASWSVDDRHRLVARCRLTQQLVAWIMGNAGKEINLAEFQEQIESPEVKEKIQEAIEKIARDLGITERAVDTIEGRVETLAHELSYIEGLRGRFGDIQAIQPIVARAANSDGGSQRIRDDSERILVLLPLSYKKIGSEFDLLFKQCQNVIDLLGDVDTYVELIRAIRDEIRGELATWDDVVEDWRAYEAKESDRTVAQVVEQTYRFLAQNYPIIQPW